MRPLLEELRKRPEVEYAKPNALARATWVPNDPYYTSSGAWGQAFADLWGLQRIGAESAWDETRGGGVVVAVLDTGIDGAHPDLAGQLWQNPGETGQDGAGRDRRRTASTTTATASSTTGRASISRAGPTTGTPPTTTVTARTWPARSARSATTGSRSWV